MMRISFFTLSLLVTNYFYAADRVQKCSEQIKRLEEAQLKLGGPMGAIPVTTPYSLQEYFPALGIKYTVLCQRLLLGDGGVVQELKPEYARIKALQQKSHSTTIEEDCFVDWLTVWAAMQSNIPSDQHVSEQ